MALTNVEAQRKGVGTRSVKERERESTTMASVTKIVRGELILDPLHCLQVHWRISLINSINLMNEANKRPKKKIIISFGIENAALEQRQIV